MKYLKGGKAKEAERYIKAAAKVASRSLCFRSKCGSVIVKGGRIIGRGYNSPPRNKSEFRTCLNEYKIPMGFRHDRTCCIHAEQRAIIDALLKNKKRLSSSSIYFVRLDKKGGVEESLGELKCTICSRAILDNDIKDFTMLTTKGIATWSAEDMDKVSYKYKTPQNNDKNFTLGN